MATITNEEFKRLYKEFKKLNEFGTDSEFADFLNEKGFRPIYKGGPTKKWTDKTVFSRRKLLNLKSNVKANTKNPTIIKTREKRNKVLTDLVNKSNQGNKYVSPAQLSYLAEKELGMKPKYESAKNIDGSLKRYPQFSTRDTAAGGKGYKVINQLETRVDKVDKVIKELLISNEPFNKQLTKHIIDKTGITQPFFIQIRDQVPSYKAIKKEAERLPQFLNKTTNKYLLKLPLAEQLREVNELIKGDPVYTYTPAEKTIFKKAATAKQDVMKYALDSWNQNRGQGEIKLFDIKGNPIAWQKGLRPEYGKVSFTYNGKKYNTSNLTPEILKKDFKEVYETRQNINSLRGTPVPNPFKKGETIPVEKLIREVQVKGYNWSPRYSTLDILHGPEGVKNKPFSNLRYNTKDINQIELGLSRSLDAGNITKTEYNKAITNLNKPFAKGDVSKAIIDRVTTQATKIKEGTFYGYETLRDNILKLNKTDVRKVCRALGAFNVGGDVAGCAAAIEADPIKTATAIEEIKPTSAALGRVKNAATAFLNFIGLGKKEGVKIFRGDRAGASGKMAKYIPGTSQVEFVPYSDKLRGRFFTTSRKVAEQFADDPSKIKSLTIPKKDFNIGTNLARRINVDQMADQLILPRSVINKLKDGTLKYDSPAFRNILRTLGKGKVFTATTAVGAGAGALVKAFRNDDPSTYLTDDKQANAMILDTADQLEREERMEAVGDAPELLDEANIAANLGVTAAAVPGASAVYQARRKPFKTRAAMGPARAALGPVGKALSGFATPLGVAAITPLNVARQVYEGESVEDIATNPLNYLGPAFAGTLTREATRGMSPTSTLSKALRLGMNPATIRTASRFFGLPGLALSLGYEGYDQYKKYTEGRGFVYNLLNKDE